MLSECADLQITVVDVVVLHIEEARDHSVVACVVQLRMKGAW